MATEKNYPLYRGIITSFQGLAANRGWRIVAEKEIQHGYQIVVTDGKQYNVSKDTRTYHATYSTRDVMRKQRDGDS